MDIGVNWNHVMFSDEKKFNLRGPDDYSSYWNDLCYNDPPRLSQNFGDCDVCDTSVLYCYKNEFKYIHRFPGRRFDYISG